MEKNEILELIRDELGKLEIPKADDIVSAVRTALADDARPRMSVSMETAQDLRARASAVSPECKTAIDDMIFDGKTEAECLRAITEKIAKPDASDTGNLPLGTGDPKPTNPAGQIIRTFKGVEDDAFFDGLANPAQFHF